MATLLIFWDPKIKVTISWCFSDACRLWGCGICDAIFWYIFDKKYNFFLQGIVDRLIVQPPLDNLPYMTLAYANGLGASINGRTNLTGVDTTDKEFMPEALVPTDSETHGGEDVPIYAHGPMAHLFHGVHEQNYVAHVMAYASCVGPNQRHCVLTSALTSASWKPTISVTQIFVVFGIKVLLLY